MVEDAIRDDLRQLVAESGKDLQWAVNKYEEAISDIQNRTLESLTEQQEREHALGMVETKVIRDSSIGSSGEEMTLEVLAIGQGGRMDDWGKDNDSVVYSYGFIYGPIGDDGGNEAGRAVFVNKASDGMDLSDVQRKFHANNTMKATYEVSESRDLDGVYRCFTSEATKLVEQELDSLPSDRDEKNRVLREAVPEATLATLHDDMSAYDPETGYTYDFGADLRRIEGKVADYYVADDGSWGRYTLMDDSVTADDIVDTDIVGDDQNVPGLTVWADPDYHMEYGVNTRADFYGTVEEGSNGNLVMNLVGVVPIIPMPMDDEDEQADEKADKTKQSL